MLIAIDIDAVLGDFLTKFLEYRNREYGTSWRREDFFSYVWADVFKESPDQMYAILADFFESQEIKEIEPVPGAVENIRYLKKIGAELDVVTSRPRVIKDLTYEWLDRHFAGSFKRVYFSNQPAYGSFGETKGEICHEIRADLFIDDQYNFCDECYKEGVKVFIFDNPWNQGLVLPKGIERVFSWPEIKDRVEKIMV